MTLTIQESDTQPEEAIIPARNRERWYDIEQDSKAGEFPDRWNQEAFDILYQLYHLTVTNLSKTPTLPITIAK